MKIINQTKNTVLAQETILADTLLARTKGLLGKKEFKVGQGLILKPCNSIHTFFMRFPIDVIFLSRDNRVIKIISSLEPFRLTSIYFNAILTIELPPGTIEVSSTQEGDFLLFPT